MFKIGSREWEGTNPNKVCVCARVHEMCTERISEADETSFGKRSWESGDVVLGTESRPLYSEEKHHYNIAELNEVPNFYFQRGED